MGFTILDLMILIDMCWYPTDSD